MRQAFVSVSQCNGQQSVLSPSVTFCPAPAKWFRLQIQANDLCLRAQWVIRMVAQNTIKIFYPQTKVGRKVFCKLQHSTFADQFMFIEMAPHALQIHVWEQFQILWHAVAVLLTNYQFAVAFKHTKSTPNGDWPYCAEPDNEWPLVHHSRWCLKCIQGR